MYKFASFFLPDEENKNEIQFIFVVKFNTDGLEKDKYDIYNIPIEDIIMWKDFVGEYDSDIIYANDDSFNTLEEAYADIIKELFEWANKK